MVGRYALGSSARPHEQIVIWKPRRMASKLTPRAISKYNLLRFPTQRDALGFVAQPCMRTAQVLAFT